MAIFLSLVIHFLLHTKFYLITLSFQSYVFQTNRSKYINLFTYYVLPLLYMGYINWPVPASFNPVFWMVLLYLFPAYLYYKTVLRILLSSILLQWRLQFCFCCRPSHCRLPTRYLSFFSNQFISSLAKRLIERKNIITDTCILPRSLCSYYRIIRDNRSITKFYFCVYYANILKYPHRTIQPWKKVLVRNKKMKFY